MLAIRIYTTAAAATASAAAAVAINEILRGQR
jgi:hypothetical protein